MNYSHKSTDYFSNIRKDLVGLIDTKKTGLRVLEIGAAYGETLYYLKQIGIAAEVVGIDIFEDKTNPQNYKQTDRFIFGNLEELEFPEYEGYFDLIMLPDVLEHVADPSIILKKIQHYLKDEGEIIVSMPNIRHYSALYKVFLKGSFDYEESGIFDYTHLRFYCRKNIAELLTSNGYQITLEQSAIKNFKGRSAAKVINTITFRLFEEFFSYQYFFKAKVAG